MSLCKNIIFLLGVCLIVSPLHAQSKKELKKQKAAEEFAETRSLVESGSFRFDAIRAISSNGRIINLTSHTAFAEISNDSAQADLSFFGTAGSVAYSAESGGIQFDGIMEGVKLIVNEDKRRINLLFSVKDGRDMYKCIFTITGKSSSSLGITSNLRSSMSYDGSISNLKEE